MRIGLAVALWFAMAVAVSANGFVGNLLVAPRTSEYAAHVYKSVIALAVVLAASCVYARATTGKGWVAAAWGAGVLWLCMTVAFEFVAGHYLFGNSWEKLLADYRFWQGRLWVVILLADLVGPAMMGWRASR